MANKSKKTTFLLGAGAGLGLLLSSHLLKEGRNLYALLHEGEESPYLKKNYPEDYHAISFGSLDPKGIQAKMEEILKESGPVDELILMDGYRMLGALEELSELEIGHSLHFNLIAPLYVLKALLPLFREQKHGRVLALLGQDALFAEPGHSLSSGARQGLRGILMSLHEEMLPFGVDVSIIAIGELHVHPEPTDTKIASLTRIYDQGDTHAFLAQLKSQRKAGPVDPEKVAKRVVKLLEKDDVPAFLVLGSQAKQDYYDQNEKTNKSLLQEEGLSSEADLIPSKKKKKSKKNPSENPLFRPGRRKKD